MENSINYMSVIPMSDKEKKKMYMRLKKEELVKMLIQANKEIDRMNFLEVTPCEPVPPRNEYC